MGKNNTGFPKSEFWFLPIARFLKYISFNLYNEKSTLLFRIELTPKVCNNVESNDLDANRLLFEHVKMQKNTNFTRSYKSLVSKDDDASAGSDVVQLEELEQYARDVVSNVAGSLTCLVFHF